MNNYDFQGKLLRVLLQIPAFATRANRDTLLISLPQDLLVGITRDDNLIADINSIIKTLDAIGQLDNGEWPLAIVIRNAMLFAPLNTSLGHQLEELIVSFENSFNIKPLTPLTSEEILIGPDERLPVDFFEQGLLAQLAVARLYVPRYVNGYPSGAVSGTGWMFSENLMLTNYHVIAARTSTEQAPSKEDLKRQSQNTVAWFNYNHLDGPHVDYKCIELIHSSPTLDFALLHLSSKSENSQVPLNHWGVLKHAEKSTFPIGVRLNIIQHPLGFEKKMAIRGNFFVKRNTNNPAFIQYITDTEPGSSGSPVFNDQWEVVAMHHASVRVKEYTHLGQTIQFHNEGIELTKIITILQSANIL